MCLCCFVCVRVSCCMHASYDESIGTEKLPHSMRIAWHDRLDKVINVNPCGRFICLPGARLTSSCVFWCVGFRLYLNCRQPTLRCPQKCDGCVLNFRICSMYVLATECVGRADRMWIWRVQYAPFKCCLFLLSFLHVDFDWVIRYHDRYHWNEKLRRISNCPLDFTRLH